MNKKFINQKFNFLVTGAAGFVGTNLTLRLLELGQNVVAVDNFITGKRYNIEYIKKYVEGLNKYNNSYIDCNKNKGLNEYDDSRINYNKNSGNFKFIECDLRDIDVCKNITKDIDFVFHEAAIASVPWSLVDPLIFHSNNDAAFFNILNASKDNKVKRLIYASSSAVYGTCHNIPSVESEIGDPLSIYAAAKLSNEIYAKAFFNSFGFESIGFRYFNVYGEFQDPESKYAAVIPIWVKSILENRPFIINGDGKTTRDFCYIDDVVDINLSAVFAEVFAEKDCDCVKVPVYNVGSGKSVTLLELAHTIKELLNSDIEYQFGPYRTFDIQQSAADITNAKKELGYNPQYPLKKGLEKSLNWYKKILA